MTIGTTGASFFQANLASATSIAADSNGVFIAGSGGGGGGLTWTDEGSNFAAVKTNGYFTTAAVVATMPASPSQGDTIAFAADSTSACTITANTGQTIRIGTAISASAGTAASTARGDSVTLVYRSSDTSWIASQVIGTWTVT